MNQVLDFVFYSKLVNGDEHGDMPTQAPLLCTHFRNLAGLFWVYPAAVVEMWSRMFLGCDCECSLEKRDKRKCHWRKSKN